MDALVNLLLVLAGAFLPAYAALAIAGLAPRARAALVAVSFVGLALMLARLPLGASSGAALASAGFAVASALATWIAVSRATGAVEPRALRQVGVALGVSVAVMAGVLWWVGRVAPSP